MAAAGGGRLAKLRYLREFDVDLNAFGEEAIGVLADAIEKDAMPSLEQLAVPSPHEFNPRLIAACEEKKLRSSKAHPLSRKSTGIRMNLE